MELSFIGKNVGYWFLDAFYCNKGNPEEIFELVMTSYINEEDVTKKEAFKEDVKALHKKLSVEGTMKEVKEALADILELVKGE